MTNDLITFDSVGRLQLPERPQVITSLDASTPEGRRMIQRARAGSDYGLDEHLNVPIPVRDVLMHWYERINETTGEHEERCRVVLITPDGQRYSTSAEAIPSCLREVCRAVDRLPPWEPHINLIAWEERSRRTKRRYIVIGISE